MSEHTKGPWTVHEVKSWVVDTTTKAVCRMLWPTESRSEEETLANARLIAAAPDLLEALEGAIRIKELWMPYEYSEKYQHEIHALASMRRNFESAIAKATGKETV